MKIKQLLSSKSKWHKGSYAATKQGDMCGAHSINAEKFCLLGAVIRCYDYGAHSQVMDELRKAIAKTQKKAAKSINIAAFNDNKNTTFEHIKEVLKIANV